MRRLLGAVRHSGAASGRMHVLRSRLLSGAASAPGGAPKAKAVDPAVLHKELRATADRLLEREEWLSAQGVLEGVLQGEAAGSAGHRRALSELALCKQSQMRFKEAIADYEASLEGDDTWTGANVAMMNYAELQASQEQWALAESLARKALKLKWPPAQYALFGAAKCNLGTYLSMQDRHEQAANELAEGATIMGKLMGRDHETVVAAAANTVRCLRAAGLAERAETFAKEWKVAEEHTPEFRVDEDELYANMQARWRDSEAKKSLDPAGFLRQQGLDEEEAEKFLVHWEATGMPQSMIKDMFEAVEESQDDVENILNEPPPPGDRVQFEFDAKGNLTERPFTDPLPEQMAGEDAPSHTARKD